MASAKETLSQAAAKAVELGGKGFHLYSEMVDKVLDSVIEITKGQDSKSADLMVKALDSSVCRKSAPYVVLGAGVFDLCVLPLINRRKKD